MPFKGRTPNNRTLAIAILTLCFSLAGSRSAQAQVDKWGAWDNGITEAWWLSSKTFTDEDLANAIIRWNSIGQVTSPGWEGDYFIGSEVHGTYVRWSREGGFIIAGVDKCQALVMSVTYGRVDAAANTIRFIPEFSKSSKPHGHHSGKRAATLAFIPVKWRDSLYLIPENEIEDFADYAAGLGQYNALNATEAILPESHFYSKYAGKTLLNDVPVLPDEYQRFVKSPIAGEITAVVGRRLQRNYSYEFKSESYSFANQYELASMTFVTVNIGSLHGAKKDLFLRVAQPNLGEAIRLVEVGPTSSKAILVREVENQKEMFYDHEAEREREYPRVKAGWTLTTAPSP
ncbi:MAG TPA: hypothetical protein VIT19_03850 [Pyrinomonadaceae bacterium]